MMTQAILTILLVLSTVCALADEKVFQVGSKAFTESVTLGEVTRQILKENNLNVDHREQLGGTRILWSALKSGGIDFYIEYTGTVADEILQQPGSDFETLKSKLREHGIGALEPLGFNNTYALGMKRSLSEKLGVKTISDLRSHPDLVMGFSAEFTKRKDGWPGLKKAYGLPQEQVRGLVHDVAYRALETENIHLTDLYSTDAEIDYYDLVVLEDDLKFFPAYEAFLLYRLELENSSPDVLKQLSKLSGQISAPEMIEMNKAAKIDGQSSAKVASAFLNQKLGLNLVDDQTSASRRIFGRVQEHLSLVVVSLLFAIFVGIPLGVLAYEKAFAGRIILGSVGIIQTIPALALLVILIKPLSAIGLDGIGNTPALIALFLYSLLPIVRGTHSGIMQIPVQLRETSEVLSLSRWTILRRIQLPLAMPAILNGIKTSAVLNIGFATIGALVGAGGLGQPILSGIRLDDYSLILEGALPAAVLAILAQLMFEFIDKKVVSPGLR